MRSIFYYAKYNLMAYFSIFLSQFHESRDLYTCTIKNWYFVTKNVLIYCEKNFPIDREKLLKFEAEGRKFAKVLRSLEQFIQTVKGQNNFC